MNITSPLGIGSQPPLDGATRRTSGFDPDATHSDPNPRVTGLGSKHSLPRHSMSVIGLPTQKDPSGTTPGLIGKYASPMGVPGEWETGL